MVARKSLELNRIRYRFVEILTVESLLIKLNHSTPLVHSIAALARSLAVLTRSTVVSTLVIAMAVVGRFTTSGCRLEVTKSEQTKVVVIRTLEVMV